MTFVEAIPFNHQRYEVRIGQRFSSFFVSDCDISEGFCAVVKGRMLIAFPLF